MRNIFHVRSATTYFFKDKDPTVSNSHIYICCTFSYRKEKKQHGGGGGKGNWNDLDDGSMDDQ